MRGDTILKASMGLFILIFFGYLLGPLIIMSMTAFNSSEFPRVTPWDCFSTEWFGVLARDEQLMTGLKNSLIIGAGVLGVIVIGAVVSRRRGGGSSKPKKKKKSTKKKK